VLRLSVTRERKSLARLVEILVVVRFGVVRVLQLMDLSLDAFHEDVADLV
jgi:hypothetical protein